MIPCIYPAGRFSSYKKASNQTQCRNQSNTCTMDFKAKLILVVPLLLMTSAFSFPLDLDINPDDGKLEQCLQQCSHLPIDVYPCRAYCYNAHGNDQTPNDEEEEMESPSGSPRQQFEQCRRRCEGGGRCEERCREAFERQQGNRREEEEVRYPKGERRYEECQRKCESRGGRGQSKQWQCQRRCQEDFQREREEGGRGRGGRGRGEGGRGFSERRCVRRCEEQGYGFDCARRCRGQHHDGDNGGLAASLRSFFA